ncbi:isocitrate lyase/PEP mutase family protein [Labedaea rhizosphaerae]|uniref:2-methylisocitrate lyase-like PEP mutase family enzyme n=1 Tax=Labedaea rhizosphaerae TaxID=598644 RepID=A0A4R6SDN6_LABRH|nr:isocitrate lyase/phosphoenolpyruvate mutase family protein [Labedaea rhizosphaerae]TDP97804.1 2-methylisocitrate lyase-like PEP mutase family enzyme [Labedaea rhizosphaerae]
MDVEKAKAFRALHEDSLLVLPNAWDAGSAAVIVNAGAKAVATTSGGVAWSLGKADGQQLGRAEMVEVVRRVVAAVDVPVTADIEGGYGPAPDDVGATIAAVVAAGAVGANLEDSKPDGTLFAIAEQAERLKAARASAPAEFVLNARTDVFLLGDKDFDDLLARARAYAEAGADCLFVPGLIDLDALRSLVDQSPLPINVMGFPGVASPKELAAIGVRRLSVGTAVAQAAYGTAARAAKALLEEGSYDALADGPDYGTMNSLFT